MQLPGQPLGGWIFMLCPFRAVGLWPIQFMDDYSHRAALRLVIPFLKVFNPGCYTGLFHFRVPFVSLLKLHRDADGVAGAFPAFITLRRAKRVAAAAKGNANVVTILIK